MTMETPTRAEYPLLVLRTRPALELSDEQFFAFCRLNDEWRIERTAEGEIEIMPPVGGGTGNRNAGITAQLWTWATRDGTGEAFDSSAGFKLPNGATRSPDASWIGRERLTTLAARERERFLPRCPDFVVELRSPSDRLRVLQAKLREYIENGARLGWLIDATDRRVEVYRPGTPVERLDAPASLSGEPELPDFVLDLRPIWEPRF
jgi:Uma2 family endonuclease